jgi:hypothetical protein
MRREVESIAREISQTGTFRDPAHGKLLETRKAVVAGWMGIAATLDAQGEIVLAGDVRYFANHLPRVLTDRERLAGEFIRHLKRPITPHAESRELVRDRALERAR